MLDFLGWLFISTVIALAGWGFIHVVNDIWDIINEKKVKRMGRNNFTLNDKTQHVSSISIKLDDGWKTYNLKAPIHMDYTAIAFGKYLRFDKVVELIEKVEKIDE